MKHVLALLALAIGTAGIVAGELGDAPGALLLGLALVLGTVAWYAKGARPYLLIAVGAAGAAAGGADDAPGAVALGLLLVAGGVALAVRSARRRPA